MRMSVACSPLDAGRVARNPIDTLQKVLWWQRAKLSFRDRLSVHKTHDLWLGKLRFAS